MFYTIINSGRSQKYMARLRANMTYKININLHKIEMKDLYDTECLLDLEHRSDLTIKDIKKHVHRAGPPAVRVDSGLCAPRARALSPAAHGARAGVRAGRGPKGPRGPRGPSGAPRGPSRASARARRPRLVGARWRSRAKHCAGGKARTVRFHRQT